MTGDKKKINVLFILNSPVGGATAGIYDLIKTLPPDIKPFVIFPQAPECSQVESIQRYIAGHAVVPLYWWNWPVPLPLLQRVMLWCYRCMRSLFWVIPTLRIVSLIRRWDIHTVYSGTILTLEGALAAKLACRKHIWHIKETFGKNGRVKFILSDYVLQRILFGLSHAIVVMSEYIKSFFYLVPIHSKIMIVPDGVDVTRFQEETDRSGFRRAFHISEDDTVVGMVASLSSVWKQHHLVLEAASKMKEKCSFKLVIFGAEPKKYSKDVYNAPFRYYTGLLAQVKSLALEKHIIWAGFQKNVPLVMRSIDILVHPCDSEPFGRVAIEAMAAGIPVVGPSTGGIAETVIGGQTGIVVEPKNADAFAEALTELVMNKERRSNFGMKGRKHVTDLYSQERHTNRIVDLLVKLNT